jgi:hypothetical protein
MRSGFTQIALLPHSDLDHQDFQRGKLYFDDLKSLCSDRDLSLRFEIILRYAALASASPAFCAPIRIP